MSIQIYKQYWSHNVCADWMYRYCVLCLDRLWLNKPKIFARNLYILLITNKCCVYRMMKLLYCLFLSRHLSDFSLSLQLNWVTLSLCLTELSVWYMFYDLRTVQLHRNCLTVRRTVYQCDKYGRLLTINDAAQFNVSYRSSMTHTNCWLYLMYYQTWRLSYKQTVNVQLSGTQISDVHTFWLCPCHTFPPPLRRHTLYPTTITVNTKHNKLMLTAAHIAVLLNWLTELQRLHKHLCGVCLYVFSTCVYTPTHTHTHTHIYVYIYILSKT